MSVRSCWHCLDTVAGVRALAAPGSDIVVALDDGSMLRSSDGGRSWVSVLAGRIDRPVTLLITDEVYWTGTASGVVRAARTEGWRPEPAAPAHVFVTALATSGKATIAGTLRAGVYRTPDGGRHWEAATHGLPFEGERLRVYAATAAPHGLVVAHALGTSLSRDGGLSWHSAAFGLPLQIPYATLASDGRTLYAEVNGHLFRAASTPAASSPLAWTGIHDGAERPLHLLTAANGVLFATATTPPFLMASADDATSWHPLADGLPEPPIALVIASPWLLALLSDGRLWRTLLAPLQPAPPPLDLRVELAPSAAAFIFVLHTSAAATLTVHDVLDREVTCLVNGYFRPGLHRVLLPAGTLPPGFYQCRLRAGGMSRTAPFVMME